LGDPKKQRKTYSTPRNPWRGDQLSQELFLLGTYGLRNKKELWKAQSELSRVRKQARLLLAAGPNAASLGQREFVERLVKMGVIPEGGGLDDVLGLSLEALLDRRLQSIVAKRGIAKTPHQARQYIVHGHIAIGNRRIRVPSYSVSRTEEGSVAVMSSSRVAARKEEAPA
jgi:small subunit ribosomal protein S4